MVSSAGVRLARDCRSETPGIHSRIPSPSSFGGILGYWIGIKGGLPLVARYGGYVGVRKLHVDKAHAFFERNGAKTILFGRFIALLRTWAAVIAGAACMSFTKFVTYNTLGSVVWAIGLVLFLIFKRRKTAAV